MEWITEPSAGAEPMCNNCFFYAHGSCSTKCSSQATSGDHITSRLRIMIPVMETPMPL